MMRMLLAILTIVTAATAAPGQTVAPPRAPAADWRAQGAASLVITYRVVPADRPAFVAAVKASLAPRLAAMHKAGTLADYRLLRSRYVDAGGWDVMAFLTFRDAAALAQWRMVEAMTPAGLPATALRFTTEIASVPGDVVRRRAWDTGSQRTWLVIPYDYLVSTDAYLAYVDGYLLPQADGWIGEGALAGYSFFLARYPADRPWSSLLMLAYRGDAGLDARDRAVRDVRERLQATSAAWRGFATNKGEVRTEKRPTVADDITP